jgi:3-hydroxyisobutyrate dehydrogenase-like beta-hydroxyacid dehydrogenase
MRIFVLGLGEAGARYAAGLAGLGHRVQAFDPAASTTPDGVERVQDAAAACRDAELVLSLVGAAAAERALASVHASLDAATLFADMNTGAPEHKRALAGAAATAGAPFVDAAIMSPVPRAGVLTPLLASGTGAERFVDIVTGWGVPARYVGPDAGSAAALKLLRSVFMKGLAGLVFEALAAAGRTGDEAWLRQEVAGELGPDGDALVERLLEGTRQHAVRRAHEMADVRDYLASIDSPAWMTEGTIAWLTRIAEEDAGDPLAR